MPINDGSTVGLKFDKSDNKSCFEEENNYLVNFTREYKFVPWQVAS